MDNKRVIVCIPAYNEANDIGPIIEKSKRFAEEVVVVDDGSTDNTAAISDAAGAIVIRNGRNIGKGAALKRGFSECLKYQPSAIVTLDGDGQHDPGEIPIVLKPIEEGHADIVIGSRFKEHSITEIPFVRGLGLSFIDKINRSLIRSSVKDSQSGFRAYSASVLRLVMQYTSNGYGAETEQLAAAELYGYRIAEVPIHVKYKGLKITSKRNKLLHGGDITSTLFRIAVERRPLLLFGLSGLAFIIAGIVTASDLVLLFNESRYFSLPLAMLTIGFGMIGALLIFASLVFYAIKRIQSHQNTHY